MTIENKDLPWVTGADTPEVVTTDEVTLVWTHPVDLSMGMGATAYGIKLVLVDGVYYGTMSADRAAVELTRASGPTFFEVQI